MTKIEERNNHVEAEIKYLNDFYEQYKKEEDIYHKAELCNILRNVAYSIVRDFKELEWLLEVGE